MKIEIKAENSTKETELIITDENLNNDNFIEIVFVGGDDVYTVSIDDLLSAIIAFESKRSRRLELDNLRDDKQ